MSLHCFLFQTRRPKQGFVSFPGKAVSHDVLYSRKAPYKREQSLQALNNNHKHGGLSMEPLLTSSRNTTPAEHKGSQHYNHAQISGELFILLSLIHTFHSFLPRSFVSLHVSYQLSLYQVNDSSFFRPSPTKSGRSHVRVIVIVIVAQDPPPRARPPTWAKPPSGLDPPGWDPHPGLA